ncbi:hypothetical protein KAU88_05645 [Candidatus Bathyarchaeota archaeon]|nr:hypothetical protein [Candidatus Bathyarchaeota archaeon]
MGNNQEPEEIQCRKLLVDTYSAQLRTHGQLIIGFAIILLTFLEIRVRMLEYALSISVTQFCIFYFGIFLIGFALWYLFLRHFVYGKLLDVAIHAKPRSGKEHLFDRIFDAVMRDVLSRRMFVVIPCCMFLSTEGRRWRRLQMSLGVLLCIILAIATTYLVWILVG